jgi:hypothetical protein
MDGGYRNVPSQPVCVRRPPARHTEALRRRDQRLTFHASRFTHHVAIAVCPDKPKNSRPLRRQPVSAPQQLPASQQFAPARCLRTKSGTRPGWGDKLPLIRSSRQTQAPYTQRFAVTGTLWSLSVFVPATSRSPRSPLPPRQTQTPGPQHKTHAGTLPDFVRKTGRMGGQTPHFFPSAFDPDGLRAWTSDRKRLSAIGNQVGGASRCRSKADLRPGRLFRSVWRCQDRRHC